MTNVRIERSGDVDVVTAARTRIRNIFNSGVRVYAAFSGGKDSLCLGQLLIHLISEGEIDPKQLTVIFIDEEAMYYDCIRSCVDWRKKFMMAGAEFRWYCLEVKHYNCFNNLENDESFICWDRNKKKDWVRPMPDFAIRYHPDLRVRHDNYQALFPRITRDGVQIAGVRMAESVQRASYMAAAMKKSKGLTPIASSNMYFPIYDWRDNDVWLYLQQNHIEYPMEYIWLWQVGVPKNKLRISQFFSIDTAGALVSLNEFQPDLMDRVTRREPNAYLASLYWDSEMFRRNTRTRRQLEEETVKVDFKKKVLNALSDIEKNFDTPAKRKLAGEMLNRMNATSFMFREKDWKIVWQILQAGDPKGRSKRGLITNVLSDYAKKVGANQKGKIKRG
jgi:predicted phosphoadenosine phosphosulfate sulfurtransferase